MTNNNTDQTLLADKLDGEVAYFDDTASDEETPIVSEKPEVADEPELPKHFIVGDGRLVFIPDVESKASNPYYTMNLSRTNFTGEHLLKCFPDTEDAVDAIASVSAGWVHNGNMVMSREALDKQTNVMTYTPTDGSKVRRQAITRPQPLIGKTTLVGEAAILAITSSLGISGRVQLPMVGSGGFRIELTRPTGEELALLDEYLLRNKGELGRFTYGASMTHNSVYITRDLVGLAFRNVKRWNLDLPCTPENLRDMVKQDDYPTLIIGLIAAILPEGYTVNVPCLSEDAGCSHITTGSVNPARMWTVDESMLTEYQLEVATRTIGMPVTVGETELYLADFKTNLNANNTYEFVRGGITCRFNYKRPTIEESIQSGILWANGVNRIIRELLQKTTDETADTRVVSRQFNLNVISQFTAWFESVQTVDSSTGKVLATVTEPGDIITLLKQLVSDDEVQRVFDDINKFIFNNNPVVVGVPNYNCKACSKPISPDNTVVVPQNVDLLFFIHISAPAVINQTFASGALLE